MYPTQHGGRLHTPRCGLAGRPQRAESRITKRARGGLRKPGPRHSTAELRVQGQRSTPALRPSSTLSPALRTLAEEEWVCRRLRVASVASGLACLLAKYCAPSDDVRRAQQIPRAGTRQPSNQRAETLHDTAEQRPNSAALTASAWAPAPFSTPRSRLAGSPGRGLAGVSTEIQNSCPSFFRLPPPLEPLDGFYRDRWLRLPGSHPLELELETLPAHLLRLRRGQPRPSVCLRRGRDASPNTNRYCLSSGRALTPDISTEATPGSRSSNISSSPSSRASSCRGLTLHAMLMADG